MKKALPNQSYIPSWDVGISDSYIRECYYHYQRMWGKRYTLGDSYYGPYEMRWSYSSGREYHYTGEKADWNLIEELYLEGRSNKVLNCDFDQFADRLINSYPRKWYRRSSLEAPYRQKHENVKWKDKGKKTLSEKEQIKRDWRKNKGRDRDSKKVSWRRSAGKWYKNHSNKLHHSWERQNINNGNWDDLVNDRKIKYFQDSWMWD